MKLYCSWGLVAYVKSIGQEVMKNGADGVLYLVLVQLFVKFFPYLHPFMMSASKEVVWGFLESGDMRGCDDCEVNFGHDGGPAKVVICG